jgi:transposase
MRSYSMDLRERVLADCDAGMATKGVAAKYRVSPAWVRRLKQRRRETGEVAPRPSRNRRRPVLELHLGRLREPVAAAPDATLRELRERLGVAVSLATLWAAVRGLGLTVKKKSGGPPSRTGPT